MDTEVKELKDAVAALAPALDRIQKAKAAVHAVIDSTVASVGAQVAADTAVPKTSS
jgi:hypothetical protein